MTHPQQASLRNRLLLGLSAEDFALLQPHLEPVVLALRQFVVEAGEPISHITFPEHGAASTVADGSEGRIEVGITGNEGMVGLPVVLGLDRSPHSTMIQLAGDGHRVPVDDFRAAFRQSASMQAWLLRYAHVTMIQTAQTAHANAGFDIEARLARWLLMMHDRAGEDEFSLTHEFLSVMLGVRRPGVTVALQVLEGNGLIRATRGRITILDRERLIETADDAYGVAEAEYANVMGVPLNGRA